MRRPHAICHCCHCSFADHLNAAVSAIKQQSQNADANGRAVDAMIAKHGAAAGEALANIMLQECDAIVRNTSGEETQVTEWTDDGRIKKFVKAPAKPNLRPLLGTFDGLSSSATDEIRRTTEHPLPRKMFEMSLAAGFMRRTQQIQHAVSGGKRG